MTSDLRPQTPSQGAPCLPNEQHLRWIDGGVSIPAGIKAAGIACGIRKNGRRDLALVCADKPVPAAGVFTQNTFCAAPVSLSRANLTGGPSGTGSNSTTAQAILINSGNANAATGEVGERAAQSSAAALADTLNCSPTKILLASTGVIGVQLPVERIENALGDLVEAALTSDGSVIAAKAGGGDAARAIMTTDTHPKERALSVEIEGRTFTFGGMAKGSGMIAPNMATMIAVLTTDAPLTSAACEAALKYAVHRTFNRVTIDSDTSTNDSCFLMATGAEGGAPVDEASSLFAPLAEVLVALCEELARDIARDGEGASKLVTVTVTGAATTEDAEKCARSIAESPLVKTAVFGRDANWGRIAMAAGKSGAVFAQTDTSIRIMGLDVCKDGLPVPFDEEEALRRFDAPEVVIEVDLGAGYANATFWTCDFTYDYVRINGEYRT